MWNNEVTKVYIVPVVIGVLGMVSKNISRFLEMIGFDGLEKLQKACLLGTAGILVVWGKKKKKTKLKKLKWRKKVSDRRHSF